MDSLGKEIFLEPRGQGETRRKMNNDLFLTCDYSTDPAPFVAYLESQENLDVVESSIQLELDKVESSLMDELSRHSSVFSNTLGIVADVKATFAGLSSATDQISAQLEEYSAKLKDQLGALDTLQQKLVYCEETRKKLTHLKNVRKTQKRIQDLINLCSFDDALFLISKTEAEISSELSDFEPFRELVAELCDMKIALEKLKHAPSLQ